MIVAAHVAKNALDVWGLDKESALHRFFVGEPVSVVAASPDGTHFAAGALSGAVYVWEVSTGALVKTWNAHFKAVSAVSFAAGGSMVITAGEDTVVSAWSMASLLDPAAATAPPVPTYSWAEHALPVTSLAVGGGPAGGAGGSGLVASASADRTCKLWTLGGGHLLRSVAFPAALACVALDACESTLYAGATDGRVFEVPLNAVAAVPGAGLESAGSGRVDGSSNRSAGFGAATLEGHARAVTAIACSADGERVTSSSEDGTCRVWDAASRQTTHVLRHPKGSPIVALAVAPRARVAGEGAGGAGERRKLAPLAPFSRFAGAGLSAAEGGLAGGKSGGGKSGRLEPWEGAPVVLRGVSVSRDRETGVVLGGDDALLGGSAPTSIRGATGAANGSGGGGKRDRSDADGPAGEGDDAVAGLRERLAAAEADAAAAREETASWKKRHGELRAFVSEELVDRETKR